MSKRGQGLAFVSIIVLIAILYFIFRFNTDTYGFIMQAGDEQAHLVTAYTEGAAAKSYVQIAARQAAFEAVWKISKSKSPDSLSKCTDPAFNQTFEILFRRYIAMYYSSTYLVETSIPNYRFNFDCSSNSLAITGWGYGESCHLQGFHFPEKPCEDETDYTNCTTNIKFSDGYSGNACKWDAALNCTDSLPEPNCRGADNSSECAAISSSYCGWRVSYAENINVVSVPLVNYQFSADSNAHFIEYINGKEYEAFADSRATIFKPSCQIAIEPAPPIANNANFNITMAYTDDDYPADINLKVSPGGIHANLTAGLQTIDASDITYSDGKIYYYSASLTNGTYNADVSCTDADGNIVTASKSFIVSP